MCLQHKVHLIGLTETHLNTIEKEKQAMNQGVGYLLLNSLITTSKGSKGTALLHFLNNKRKRCITNTNLVPGHLQWTRFYSRNMPINILTVYLSGRREANDVDDDVFEHIIEVLTECQDEQVVIMGDFNINSHNPSSTRDKQWLELMNSFQMYEHKVTGNFSYVRRNENQIYRSRPDHIFVSKHIRVVREQMLAPISKNDHLPFFVDLEFQSNLSWKPSVSKNSKTKIIEYLNNSNFANFEDLARALGDQIDKYGKYNDRLGIQSIYSSLRNRIEELEQSLLTSIQGNELDQKIILDTQQELKEAYKSASTEIKEKISERFNAANSSAMYHFDQLIHNKQIDWKQINFNDSQIVQHFKDKFTSSNQTPTFSPSPSTVSEGPQVMNPITLNDLESALSRMKSNTPGVDFIPHDIVKGLNDLNKKLLVDKFNECLVNQDIPNAWKQGWVKLIPKRDVKTLSDIRPITILPIFYRIFFNIIAFRLREWANSNINMRQQAFITDRSTLHHGMLLSALALKSKSSFLLVNLDIEGAYDAVEMSVIKMALQHCKFPPDLIDFIINSYSNHSLQLEINDHLSSPFVKTRGIPQGCPLAPLVYDCITQLIIDKAIEKWNIPITPTELDVNDIGLLNFADDMNIVCNRHVKYNDRLDDVDTWLSQLLFKINPSKSKGVRLPSKSKMTPKIKGTVIPLEPNLRVLGHYPWSDRIVNADVNDKIEKLRLSLKYLPVRRLEPLNLKKVIHAKAISLFTHLSKTNFISKKHLESINSSIRSAIKRRMLIDVRTPSGFFHLPTTLSGLDIPSIVEFIEHIHLRTLMLMANHPNNLIRKAYVFGMSHHKDTENNIFHHWKSILKEYNISVKLNNQQFSLPQLSGTNFEIHTDGSRQNGKSGMGINIYDHSHTPKQLHSHSLRIHDGYSHNIAELASILTSIHLLPNHSKATIHTDSQVAIQALKKNYRGRFLLFYREFQKIIRARSLQISLKKVKGHKDPENIKVDALARQSLSQPTIFDIRQLFVKQRLLTKTDIIIFNQREMTQTFHHKKMTTKLDDNPNLIDHVHRKSLNIRFLKAKISPNYKYAVWRNITDSHIRHFTGSYCPDCEVESNLHHYIHECPKLDPARYFCEMKISSLISQPCTITDSNSWFNPHRPTFYVHHSGFLPPDSDAIRHVPAIERNWPEIQVLLALFVGRCHKYYYSDKIED